MYELDGEGRARWKVPKWDCPLDGVIEAEGAVHLSVNQVNFAEAVSAARNENDRRSGFDWRVGRGRDEKESGEHGARAEVAFHHLSGLPWRDIVHAGGDTGVDFIAPTGETIEVRSRGPGGDDLLVQEAKDLRAQFVVLYIDEHARRGLYRMTPVGWIDKDGFNARRHPTRLRDVSVSLWIVEAGHLMELSYLFGRLRMKWTAPKVVREPPRLLPHQIPPQGSLF